VFDRITIFEDHLVRDIDAGRFPANTNLVLITHGLTLRIFLSRWFHWTVKELEAVWNPLNSEPIVLERVAVDADDAEVGRQPKVWVVYHLY
jgi:broad specificity phosphatase PhoE